MASAQIPAEGIAPTVSSAEIDISELEMEGVVLADSAEGPPNGEILPKAQAYVADSEFDNAPRAQGSISFPPTDKASSSSFKTIQTLLQLEGLTGVSFRDLENLPDEEAELFRKVMLLAVWPETESQARRVIIDVLQILEPKYRASMRWQGQSLASLRQVFLQELQRKGGQLAKLADKLRKAPPPMPPSKPKPIIVRDKTGK